MSTSKIINTLWPLIDGHKLTDDQLKRLCCAEDLDTTMRNAANVLEGVGCMVAVDGTHEAGAGNFQEPDSVFRILCFFADFIDSAAAAYRVAGDATTILHERQMERVAEQSKGENGTNTQGRELDLSQYTDQLEEYASQLSAIKPVLNNINDSGNGDQPVFGQLELVATVTDDINSGLSAMVEKLKGIGKQAA
jgi:hypothetical protein